MTKNPYDILGVSKEATREEIKRAYHARAKHFHPDKLTPEAAEQLKDVIHDINAAKEVLLNKKKRAIFDEYGVVDTTNNRNQIEKSIMTSVINQTLQMNGITPENFVHNMKRLIDKEIDTQAQKVREMEQKRDTAQDITIAKYRGIRKRADLNSAAKDLIRNLNQQIYVQNQALEAMHRCLEKADDYADDTDHTAQPNISISFRQHREPTSTTIKGPW